MEVEGFGGYDKSFFFVFSMVLGFTLLKVLEDYTLIIHNLKKLIQRLYSV